MSEMLLIEIQRLKLKIETLDKGLTMLLRRVEELERATGQRIDEPVEHSHRAFAERLKTAKRP